MGRHEADKAPANDMFMVTVLAALLVLLAIVVALAVDLPPTRPAPQV